VVRIILLLYLVRIFVPADYPDQLLSRFYVGSVPIFGAYLTVSKNSKTLEDQFQSFLKFLNYNFLRSEIQK